MEFVIKKCLKCGAMVEVLDDCSCPNCGIKCCGENMVIIKPNSTDASFEKHVPTYEIKEDKILAKVNHVMEDEHYIMWICFVSKNKIQKVVLKPHQKPEAVFDYEKGTLYAYCNKHSLWEAKVK